MNMIPKPPLTASASRGKRCTCIEKITALQEAFGNGIICSSAAEKEIERLAKHVETKCQQQQCKAQVQCSVSLFKMSREKYSSAFEWYERVAPADLPNNELKFKYYINFGAVSAAVGELRHARTLFSQAKKYGDLTIASHNENIIARQLSKPSSEPSPASIITKLYVFEISNESEDTGENSDGDSEESSRCSSRQTSLSRPQLSNETLLQIAAVDDEILSPSDIETTTRAATTTNEVKEVVTSRASLPEVPTESSKSFTVPQFDEDLVSSVNFQMRSTEGIAQVFLQDGVLKSSKQLKKVTSWSADLLEQALKVMGRLHEGNLSWNGLLTECAYLTIGSETLVFLPVFLHSSALSQCFRADVKGIVKLMEAVGKREYSRATDVLRDISKLSGNTNGAVQLLCGKERQKQRGNSPTEEHPTPSNLFFSSTEHVEICRSLVKTLVTHPTEEPAHVSVSRAGCVDELCFYFASLEPKANILKPIRVAFAGEGGVDGGNGGVCNELFSTFVDAVSARLLEGTCTPEHGLGLGALIAKSILDDRVFGADLPLAFYDVVCGLEASVAHQWDALQRIDSSMAKSLSILLVDDSLDVDAVFPGIVRNDEDRVAAVTKLLYDFTIGRRLEALQAVRQGFERFAGCFPSILRDKMLRRPIILKNVFEGDNDVPAKHIVSNLEFRGWEGKESTPFYVCCWLHSTSALNRKCFVRFATGSTTLPLCGLSKRVIIFRSTDQLASQTCFGQINMPPFTNADELNAVLDAAMVSVRESPEMYEHQPQ